MTQATLFPRANKIARAYARASAEFITNYRKCVRVYGIGEFGAWDITAKYCKIYGAMTLTEKRSLGGLFTEMQKEGLIEKAGYAPRKNGNYAALYRRK